MCDPRERWTAAHWVQINTPMLSETHSGLGALQSAQVGFTRIRLITAFGIVWSPRCAKPREIYSVNLSFHIVACRSFAAWNTSPGGTGGVMLIDRLSGRHATRQRRRSHRGRTADPVERWFRFTRICPLCRKYHLLVRTRNIPSRVHKYPCTTVSSWVFVSIFGSDCLPSKLSGAQASSVFADIPDEFLTDVELGKFSDGDIRVSDEQFPIVMS